MWEATVWATMLDQDDKHEPSLQEENIGKMGCLN